MAQLVQVLLLTPEICGSNPVIKKLGFVNTVLCLFFDFLELCFFKKLNTTYTYKIMLQKAILLYLTSVTGGKIEKPHMVTLYLTHAKVHR